MLCTCAIYNNHVTIMVICVMPVGNGNGVCFVCASDRVKSEEDARGQRRMRGTCHLPGESHL